jgi:CRP-like cAMP-binding protein
VQWKRRNSSNNHRVVSLPNRAGVHVIRQGEQGDVLYIVESGQLDCYKKFKPDEPDKLVK